MSSLRHVAVRVALTSVIPLMLAAVSAGQSRPDSRVLDTKNPIEREDFDLALAQYASGDYSGARAALVELALSLVEQHDREIAALLVAKCDYMLGHHGQAIAAIERFREHHPASPYLASALLLSGHANYARGNLLAAAQAYLAVGDVDPKARTEHLAQINLEPLVTRALTLARVRELVGAASGRTTALADWVQYWGAERFERADLQTEADRIWQRLRRRGSRSAVAALVDARPQGGRLTTADEVTLGVLAPFSGAYADYGRELWRGARTAADLQGSTIGDRWRWNLDSADTGGDPRRAVLGAKRLAGGGAVSVIGPLVPEAVIGAAVTLDYEGVPQLIPAATRPGLTDLSHGVYQMSPTPDAITRRLVRFVEDRWRARTWAVLAPNNDRGRRAAEVFVAEARSLGGRIYPPQFFEPGAIDFGGQLKRIRRYIIHELYRQSIFMSPEGDDFDEEELTVLLDCLYIPASAEDLNYILPAVRFYSFRTRILGGDGFVDITELQRAAKHLERASFASSIHVDYQRPAWQRFEERYRELYGDRPDWVAARGHDCLALLLAAGERTTRKPDAAGLQSELVDVSVEGALGRVSFGSNRINAGLPVYEYRDRAAVRIDTLPPPVIVPDSVYVRDYLLLHPEADTTVTGTESD